MGLGDMVSGCDATCSMCSDNLAMRMQGSYIPRNEGLCALDITLTLLLLSQLSQLHGLFPQSFDPDRQQSHTLGLW